MDVQSLIAAQSDGASSASAKAGKQAETDKQTFLKLLVAQLEKQDPLSPVEGTEFVGQLAQFTAVEQSIQQNASLELISLQLSGLANNEAIGLIGKEVTVRGRSIAFDGVSATGFSAGLEDDAAKVSVTIRDSDGKAVRTMELGAQQKGPLSVPWNGKNDNGVAVPPGSYSVEVSAQDAKGNPVTTTQDVRGKVVGVSFDKGYPELMLDTGAKAPISDLVAVHGTAAAADATTGPDPSAPAQASTIAAAIESALAKLGVPLVSK
jgi:flagellar basal-body rod modification protein FlgD